MQPCDLTTPPSLPEKPAARRRVRQTLAGYEGTDIHHTLALPAGWDPGWRESGARYPVLIEYTGNLHPASGSTGEIEDANLGYGLSAGASWIWVVLPCVDPVQGRNAVTWWGDRDATVAYCLEAVHHVHRTYGGDAGSTLICGFSRGAIAASHIGLADDEIASLWCGFYGHDNFDGLRTTWPYQGCDALAAARRLQRLRDRPVLVSCARSLPQLLPLQQYLETTPAASRLTFIEAPVADLFEVPGEIRHVHTDLWLHKPSPARERARAWLGALRQDYSG